MGFLKNNRIKFGEIYNSVREFLTNVYSQSGDLFTSASPYGQILQVLDAFTQMMFLYIEDAIVESNIYTASKDKSIYSWARLAGHNPTRAISAQGTISISIKPSFDNQINASYVIITDKTKLLCENNNQDYFISLNNSFESLKVNLTDRTPINLKIIQGKIETVRKISNGAYLQSYSVISKGIIDNDNVVVYVNGEPYEIVDSLYDMTKNAKLCMVKTGLSGGIDVYFGNEDYGTVPQDGALIDIEYIDTSGFSGNLFSKSNSITFKRIDTGFSNNGEIVDLNEMLLIQIDKPIILGADSESAQLTKLIAPKTSRSLVLANPDNYINLLSRFNYSFIDAYTTYDDEYIADDNVVYLFLIPDISKRLTKNSDYFATNLDNFILDEQEKDALY